MIVKVCGVRTPEVAEAAVTAGADWVGLVFEPRSPRFVDAAQADAVREAVARRAALVGVMVAPHPGALALVERHRLDALQLHGAVSPRVLALSPVPVIRAVNIAGIDEVARLEWPADCLLLLDAAPGHPGAVPGGTGLRVDLEVAAAVSVHRDVVLAGGLGPETVDEAVRRVRPWGVDASSGLESSPGVKDVALVRAFIATARAAR